MNNFSDIRQSKGWEKYLETLNWRTEIIKFKDEAVRVYIRHLPIFGSLIKIPRTHSDLPFSEIDKIAKKHHAILVKLEPINISSPPVTNSIITNNYISDTWPLLPTKTIQIDVRKSEKELLAGLSKDAKYCLRKARGNELRLQVTGYRLQVTGDGMRDAGYGIQDNEKLIDVFYRLWAKNAQDKGFWVPFGKEIKTLWEAFTDDARLIFITHDPSNTTVISDLIRPAEAFGEARVGDPEYSLDSRFRGNDKKRRNILAGALLIKHASTMYYMHAFSTPEGRSLNAPYLLVWESMLLAKKLKCHTLDLEGNWDERFPKRNKKWQGFTHFKKSFGGREVEYPGSFIKYYSPFWKLFFKLGNIFLFDFWEKSVIL